MTGLEWISELVAFLAKLFPHIVLVKATHGGIKFVRGKKVVELEPGLHWYWPLLTEYVEIATARQTINFENQVVLTTDGSPLATSGVVVYEIRDVVKALSRSYDVEDTIADVGLTAITETISRESLSGLMELQSAGSLIETLTKTCRRRLSPFGVRVITCALTDFSTCVVLKTLGSTSAPMLPGMEEE